MFKRILLPFDGLSTTLPSVLYAVSLAKLLNAKLYVIHVVTSNALKSVTERFNKSEEFSKKYCANRINGIFNVVKENAKKVDLKDCEIAVVFAETVDKGVIAFSEKNKTDLCIMQPSPYHKTRMAGDITKNISSKTKMAILFIRSKSAIKKGTIILAPFDEKKENIASVKTAIDLTKKINGKLILYHTTWKVQGLETNDTIKHCDQRVLDNLEVIKRLVEENEISYEQIIETAPTILGGILQCAVRKEVGLIVMSGSTSLIGGQAELVLENSMHPLLLIKT
ncbi:universal stress protein [Candidatus Woesearchaeota archaeon]|nr:universal stress protein [Candidatus Woesearchaeota archaeon]